MVAVAFFIPWRLSMYSMDSFSLSSLNIIGLWKIRNVEEEQEENNSTTKMNDL